MLLLGKERERVFMRGSLCEESVCLFKLKNDF